MKMKDHEITYHKATAKDVNALADNRIEFLVTLLGPQSNEAIAELRNNLNNYFAVAIQDEACIFYLAKQGHLVVGTGGAIFRTQPGTFKNPSGRVAYLLNMYTAPAFRKKGICKAILDLLKMEAMQKGFFAFELHATKEGEPVYQKNGFQMHHEPTYRLYTSS